MKCAKSKMLPLKMFVLIFSLLSSIFVQLNADEAGLRIELPHGKLLGRDNVYYYSYESIPYAEPPTGDLRFEAPVPYRRQWQTEFDATHPPVECLQWDQYINGDDKLVGQEDCLTVNIYKPNLVNSTANNAKLPVLAYIHGGAFMFGSTQKFDVSYLMRSGRFIVALFTYRLGPLGFLSAEDAVLSGNYGLKDQRLALQWIKQNIVHFGGDAEKILVLGFSAGAASVHFQMLQPDFKSIAKAAASLSGTALVPWALMRNARSRAFEMAKNLKCDDLETSLGIKTCFKSKKAEDIVSGSRNFLVFGYNPFTTFGPVVEAAETEDAFLTKLPEVIIESGNFSQIPWLVTYTAQDGAYNAAELLQKQPRRDELIEVFNERWYDLAPYNLFFKDAMKSVEELDDYSMALKKRYLGDREFSIETYFNVQHMYTDVLFKNGAQKAVELHKNFTAPVYAYVYDNPSDENFARVLSQRNDINFGTVHGDDFKLIMPYIGDKKELRADQRSISAKFIKMLAHFVQTDGELIYDTCKFVDNAGRKTMALMFIKKDTCESKDVDNFPSSALSR